MPGRTLPNEHRLHQSLQKKRYEFSARNYGVAAQYGQERFGGEHLAEMSPGKRNENFFKAGLLDTQIAHFRPG
jgi:hypothetical protein